MNGTEKQERYKTLAITRLQQVIEHCEKHKLHGKVAVAVHFQDGKIQSVSRMDETHTRIRD